MPSKPLAEIRKELDGIVLKVPGFTKSTRGEWLYNAVDKQGEKVKVQFKGNNFKVFFGDLKALIWSLPLKTLPLNKVDCLLRGILQIDKKEGEQ